MDPETSTAVADFDTDLLTEDFSPPPEPPSAPATPQGEAPKPPPPGPTEVPKAPAVGVPSTPPAVPPAVTPTQPAKPEVAAPSTPAPPETPTPTPAPTEPKPITPEEIAARRTALVGEIEKKYGFTQEDQEKLLTEPHVVLPKVAANLYVDVYEGVLQTLMSQLPRLIGTYQQQFRAASDNEEAFYKAWPQLKRNDSTHSAVVRQLATVFRQTYPKATREEFIKSVGAMAAVQLGVATSPPAPAPPPKAPPSFTPAGTGTVGSSPPVHEENNPFADILELE